MNEYLESVGCYYNEKEQMVYPAFDSGAVDYDCATPKSDLDQDFINQLSEDDWHVIFSAA